MPSKKTKTKSKTISPRKRSKKTAAPMPSLLFNDTFSDTGARPNLDLPSSADLVQNGETRHRAPRYSNYSNEARRYLYTGVIIISAVIFFLWGWSLKKQITSVNWDSLPEKKILEARPTDWDSIFAERAANQSALVAKQQLSALVTALNTVTSTVSSTQSNTTTTPPTASSTQPTLPASKPAP